MASHSSRKRSSRREANRQYHKRQRQADRQALQGGNSRLVRPERWAARPQQPLIADEGRPMKASASPRNKQPKSSRARKREAAKKESRYCPGRPGQKRHHFLREEIEVTRYRPARNPDGTINPDKREPYKTTRTYELCAYCDAERGFTPSYYWNGRWIWFGVD